MRWCLLLLSLAMPVYSQVSSGVLVGTVVDQSGAPIAAARIAVRNDATGFSRETSTQPGGAYRFDDLAPGAYTLTAARSGFQTLEASHIVLEINRISRFDVTLRLGARAETVQVVAEVSPVQTDDASQGYLLGSSFLRDLPLPDRNVIELVTLGPGAIPRQLGGFVHDIMNDLQAGRGAVALNPPVNGARSTANSYMIDGVYNTDRNTFAIAVTPPLESVAEFRVQTSLAPAEFAQSGGAVMDVATQSGTRSFHGSAFEFFQNEATDAKGFFEVPGLPRGIFRQNQYGASLGGPLSPATFFFATYEGLRGENASATQHLVPTAALRGGDFNGQAAIFDPLSLTAAGARQPFPNDTIPADRIDPHVRQYLDQFEPLPNRPGNAGSNYVDSTPNQRDSDNGSLRIDRGVGTRGHLFGRYTINDERTLLAGAFPERPTSESLRAQQAALGYTLAGNSWANDTRVAFTRLRVFDLPLSAFGTDVLANLGINGFSHDPFTYGLPSMVVTDFDTVQDSNTLPQLQRDNTWYAANDFSKSQGRHTWKAGAQFTRFQMAYLQSQYVRGQFVFNGGFTNDPSNPNATGDAFADFLLGYPATTRRNVGTTQAYLRQNDYAAYFQDDWRVTSRITFSAGLRYEYTSPYTDANGQLLNLDFSTLPAAPVLKPVQMAVKPDYNNFAPRAGLAIRLPHLFHSNADTVFRAGYGIYYSPEIAIENYDLLRNGVRNEINEPGTATPLLTFENGFPVTSSTGFPTYYGLDPNARTPYVQQWSASLQQELPGQTLLDIAYLGTKGTDLGRFRRLNTPAHVETGENLPPRPGDLQSLRAFPDLGTLFEREHLANSIYHALQVKVEKRLSSRLGFLASFVFGKSIDNADSIVPGQYESFGAQDERNLRLERGLSFFDVRRRLSAGFVYLFPHSPVFSPVLSNWELSGSVTLQDGTPQNPVYFATDFANSGTPNRPNVVPGQNVLLPSGQRNADQFYNAAAFSDPAPYTFGNAGRDILPGPGNEVVNLSLHRRFSIAERASAQVRADVFNAMNHPNIGIPGPYPDFGPFFGKAFSAGDPRRLQFGVRFDF